MSILWTSSEIAAACRGEASGAFEASGVTFDSREVGDRRAAIRAAIAEAGTGDIVLVAGKGHEQGQIVGSGEATRIFPFDDVTVARECAAELAGADR